MKSTLPLPTPQVEGVVRDILFHLNMLRAEVRRVLKESSANDSKG